MTDRYPCVDPPYATAYEATIARDANQGRYQRVIWRCIEGHFHEEEVEHD